MDFDFLITKEQVAEIKKNTIGVVCSNKCNGAGVVVEKVNKGIQFNDCTCVKEFIWNTKLVMANVPIKHWDFSLRNLLKKFIDDNNTALALLKGYAEQADKMVKEGVGIYLQGSYGLAKTALASYICREFIKADKSVYFIRMSHLTKLLFESLKDEMLLQKLNWIRKEVQLLVIDEIEKDYKIDNVHSFSGVQISDIFDDFYETKKCLVVTANVPKLELGKVHSKNVVDRIQELVDIPLVGESYRGKADKKSLILEGMRK